MNKIKIECTEEQKMLILKMIDRDDESCVYCPISNKCISNYKYCPDVWNNEVDWIIR